jgi:hypothetical protein
MVSGSPDAQARAHDLAPPADRASWIELVSVDLGNGSGISDQGGDKVGVATAWEPPSAWDGVTEQHMRDVYNYLDRHGPQRWHPDAEDKTWFGWQVGPRRWACARDRVRPGS